MNLNLKILHYSLYLHHYFTKGTKRDLSFSAYPNQLKQQFKFAFALEDINDML
jgi:hypothetical protein